MEAPIHPFVSEIRTALQPDMDLITGTLLGIKEALREQGQRDEERWAELRQTFTPTVAEVAMKISEYAAAVAARKGTR